MKRHKAWWFGSALLGALGVACWVASTSPRGHDISVEFVGYEYGQGRTNSTYAASTLMPEITSSLFGDPTWIVLQITNRSNVKLFIHNVTGYRLPRAIGVNPATSDDIVFFPSGFFWCEVRPNSASRVQVNLVTPRSSWKAEIVYSRDNKFYQWIARLRQKLPQPLGDALGRVFQNQETYWFKYDPARS